MTLIFLKYSVIQVGFVKFNCISKMHSLFGKLFNVTKPSFEFFKYINIEHFIIMVFTSCKNINYFSDRFRLSKLSKKCVHLSLASVYV